MITHKHFTAFFPFFSEKLKKQRNPKQSLSSPINTIAHCGNLHLIPAALQACVHFKLERSVLETVPNPS